MQAAYNVEMRDTAMPAKINQKEIESIQGWVIENAEARSKIHTSFKIPSKETRESVKKGYWAKLIFTAVNPPAGERLWVEVTQVMKAGYVGVLRTAPVTPPLKDILFAGTEVYFLPECICGVTPPEHKDG